MEIISFVRDAFLHPELVQDFEVTNNMMKAARPYEKFICAHDWREIQKAVLPFQCILSDNQKLLMLLESDRAQKEYETKARHVVAFDGAVDLALENVARTTHEPRSQAKEFFMKWLPCMVTYRKEIVHFMDFGDGLPEVLPMHVSVYFKTLREKLPDESCIHYVSEFISKKLQIQESRVTVLET